jgi:hypothetical protein
MFVATTGGDWCHSSLPTTRPALPYSSQQHLPLYCTPHHHPHHNLEEQGRLSFPPTHSHHQTYYESCQPYCYLCDRRPYSVGHICYSVYFCVFYHSLVFLFSKFLSVILVTYSFLTPVFIP